MSAKPRYAMTVDTRRCVGCNACVLACKAENKLPERGFRDWIVTETKGVFPHLTQEIRSERCNHCDITPCTSACPTGASHVEDGGAVVVAKEKCTGCKACIAACPYNVRYVHPGEPRGLEGVGEGAKPREGANGRHVDPGGYVDKCTFCLHRVRRGQLPACVEICPTNALAFGDLADPSSPVSRLLRERAHRVLKPETGLHPNVYFLE